MIKNTDFTKSVQKNYQTAMQQRAITNLGQGIASDFQSFYIILCKMSSFQFKKFWSIKRNKKYDLKDKEQSIETFSEEVQMLNLLDKVFKSSRCLQNYKKLCVNN